jgi:hypothetical protein
MGAMWPSNDAGAPIGWYEIVRFNDTSSLDSNSPLFMGWPNCPWGYDNFGIAFGNSRDEIYNLDKSQLCCVPWGATRYKKVKNIQEGEVARLSSNKRDYCFYANELAAGPVLRVSWKCRDSKGDRAWIITVNQLMWIL